MYRAAGAREIWNENMLANPGSFGQTAGMNSDGDWRLGAGNIQLSPARVMAGSSISLAHDTTAYATIPVEDGWIQHFYGTPSPAKVTAGANLGTNKSGSIT
jgi:hypothetical protein